MRAHENPFATDRVEQLLHFRPEWIGTTWEEIEEKWDQLGSKASIVGPHGVGKTTLIDAWSKRLVARGENVVRIFLNTERRWINDWDALRDSAGKIVILDGEEQLSWIARRRFYRLCGQARGLVVTRHSKGRLPTLLEVDARIEVLQRCLQKIAPEIEFPDLERWWKEEHGNMREILLRCYDHCRDL